MPDRREQHRREAGLRRFHHAKFVHGEIGGRQIERLGDVWRQCRIPSVELPRPVRHDENSRAPIRDGRIWIGGLSASAKAWQATRQALLGR